MGDTNTTNDTSNPIINQGKLSLRDRSAVFAAQAASTLIKKMGLGLGSNLPGRIARKVSPGVLGALAAQSEKGILAVTGTNGKSTTSGILSSILRTAGFTFAHNKQGANLVTGITASLVQTASIIDGIKADYCLFEIDEAALPLVAREAHIKCVVVTNLFRDQLDRFGELDTTSKLIAKGIMQDKSHAVLNADDPNVAQMVPDVERLFYGIEQVESGAASVCQVKGEKADSTELAYCRNCQTEVVYDRIFYGQIGHWRCPACDHHRPTPQVRAFEVAVGPLSSRFKLALGDRVEDCYLPLPGLFNVYNALAAAACAYSQGVSPEAIRSGIKEYTTLFGRSEKMTVEGKPVVVQLIKNPAGATQAVASCVADSNPGILIAINDNLADGRDVSWLWDADFEQLATKLSLDADAKVTVSGQRAEDMAIRMKYAGLAADRIIVQPRLPQALRSALDNLAPGQTLWILPTYTNLLDLQKIMKTMGAPMSGT